jgi:hypothetical protein
MNQAYIYLFNKGKGFKSSFIPSLDGFIPAVLSKENQNVRRQLSLDVTHTEYHHLSYLSLLDRYPNVKDLLTVPHTAFSVEDYDLPRSTISNALFVTDADDPTFTETTPYIPINTNFQVRFDSVDKARVVGNTFEILVDTKTEVTPDNTIRLSVNFDYRIPIRGDFILEEWRRGSQFEMNYTPKSFPYETAYRRVTEQKDYLKILGDLDFEDPFFNAHAIREKLAVIIAALINSTYAETES